jgi:hypothetical protein
MENLYLIFVVVGATLFFCQLAMSLFGVGHGHDGVLDHDTHLPAHSGAAFWSLLSFRAIVAAVTVFGLVGKIGQSTDMPATPTLIAAVVSALVAMFGVALLVRSMHKLNADGTARIENARGATGSVYVNIPGDRQGAGRVQLEIQNRTVELQAITFGPGLDSGTRIVVVDVVPPDTVEVIAAAQQRIAHV